MYSHQEVNFPLQARCGIGKNHNSGQHQDCNDNQSVHKDTLLGLLIFCLSFYDDEVEIDLSSIENNFTDILGNR